MPANFIDIFSFSVFLMQEVYFSGHDVVFFSVWFLKCRNTVKNFQYLEHTLTNADKVAHCLKRCYISENPAKSTIKRGYQR